MNLLIRKFPLQGYHFYCSDGRLHTFVPVLSTGTFPGLANVLTCSQNGIFKLFVDEESMRKKMLENKNKPAEKKSGFQKRLEDMAKKRGYKAPKR